VRIAAQAAGPPVLHVARLIRSESCDRGDQFISDKFSLSDQRRRAATSAIKSPRARPLARSSIKTNERFVISRRSSTLRPESASRLTRLWKPLFFGPKSYFSLQWEQPDTDASRAGINRILRSGGFRIAQHHHLANSGCRRGCIPKRWRKSPRKKFLRLASRDAFVTCV